MNLLIIGNPDQAEECRQKFGQQHNVMATDNYASIPGTQTPDVIFDFNTPRQTLENSADVLPPGAFIFFDTSARRLTEIVRHFPLRAGRSFGFCGLKTLVNRSLLEVSLADPADRPALETLCNNLGTEFRVVADQAGMVTPRVLCMIINEAYYTLEEGTATKEDIDLAMKLGTNYPYGPFEWADRIGLVNVKRVLEAALLDSHDDRYRVCPLLVRLAEGGEIQS